MKYKSVIVTRIGGPEVLQVVENELRAPSAKEVCIKVLAASVCRPDITVRSGEGLYSGTPLGQKIPFVPGYSIIGDIVSIGKDVGEVAVGDRVGALTVIGGYSEYLYWRSDRLIPVPASVDPAKAVTIILNYLVAYQIMHRSVRVNSGEKALIIGASGGIGTALLQLGKLSNLKMYGLASAGKHVILEKYGAIPVDYHSLDCLKEIRRMEPDGLDLVFDGMMRMDYIRSGVSLLRQGGRWVSFGEPDGFSTMFRILGTSLKVNLLPGRKTFKLYGTSFYFVGDKKPFSEDWTTLFNLLKEGKIDPIIAGKYPILDAAQANTSLESGQVIGNLVLLSPDIL